MSERKNKTPAGTDVELERAMDSSKSAQSAAAGDASTGERSRRWGGTSAVLVFATEKPGRADTSAPFLVIPEAASSFLPQHPGGLEWRYFATMRLDDQMLTAARPAIEAAFRSPGYYISDAPIEP